METNVSVPSPKSEVVEPMLPGLEPPPPAPEVPETTLAYVRRRCGLPAACAAAGVILGAAMTVVLTPSRKVDAPPPAQAAAAETAPAPAPEGIPVSLLGDESAEEAWRIVANMSGVLDGDTLQFANGLAQANGRAYRVVLDLCCDPARNFAYAKVRGRRLWVAKVGLDGRIVASYPCPENGKPLKVLFGK